MKLEIQHLGSLLVHQQQFSGNHKLQTRNGQRNPENKRRLDNGKFEVLPFLAGDQKPKRIKCDRDDQNEGQLKDTSTDFAVEPCIRLDDKENDPVRLQQRQKQVDYGKNTLGYERYLATVPREKRERGVHFWTPNIYRKCSKRAFAGQIRVWRRELHKWDPPKQGGDDDTESSLKDLSAILEDCNEIATENDSLNDLPRMSDGGKDDGSNIPCRNIVNLEEEFQDLNALLDLYEQLNDEND